jgi:rare lipoprotein A
MLVKTALIAHSLAGALAANTGPLQGPTLVASTTTQAAERVIEVGEATWYHRQHSRNITASGERFNPASMTAAHRSIRLGTVVRVTDQASGRSVVVKVNDREPPHGVRCIDLSEGAALALGIHQRGVARVTITAVSGDADATEVAEAPDPADAAATPAPAAAPAHHRHHAAAHKRH